jgi:uncharacterized protein
VVRRIGVAFAVLLIVGAAAWGMVALLGGSDEPVAEGSSSTEPSASPATEPVESTVATTVAPTMSTTTTTTPTPSEGTPARILVVGDSDAGTFGPYLKELLDDTGVAETTVDYKVSSGLSRPDFFDWPAHLRAQLPDVDPDIVVVTFGGNDAQGMARADGSFPSEWSDPVAARETWFPEYERRAGEVMDLLAAEGRTVVWVGIPNDDNPDVTARLEVQDEAVRAAIAQRPRVVFVDTWARFSSGNGGWAEYVIDPRDGAGKDVRAEDGFHLNENGAEILALDIAEVIKSDLRARGAQL